MTTDRDVLPAGADTLPGSIPTKVTADERGKRPEPPGFVRNRPESSGFAGKRPESSGIAPNRPEMSRNVKVRRGENQNSGRESSVSNGLPAHPADGVTAARTRRKYGDWQMAAELFALGRTPAEVADVLGVPLPKVIRNLRESRRLRRWIADYYARRFTPRAERFPPGHSWRPMRSAQWTRTGKPGPAGGARRSAAKSPRD